MKSNHFIFAIAIAMLLFSVVVGVMLFNESGTIPATQPKQEQQNNSNDKPKEQAKGSYIPQLNEERADAATMVLISAPTLQPADHVGRWNHDIGQDSCLMCHAQSEATGAREIPIDHFNDQDRSKGIFGARNQCITCHGLESGETKPAFNRES